MGAYLSLPVLPLSSFPFWLCWSWILHPASLRKYLFLHFQHYLHLLMSSFSLCSCSQLEEHSGTWAGSSLRRTFSFLLGMTGKAKVGVSWGSRRLGTHCPPQFLFSHPTIATSHHSPYWKLRAMVPFFYFFIFLRGGGLCLPGWSTMARS